MTSDDGFTNDEPVAEPEFWSLGGLLGRQVEPYSIGQLATAIEKGGVHGWDRYGRLRLFDPASEEAREALDALASQHSWEQTFDPDGPPSPLDIDQGDDAFSRYGWPTSLLLQQVLPPLQDSVRRRSSHATRVERADLRLIGALLMVILGRKPFKKPAMYTSEAQLIGDIAQHMGDYDGTSKRTMEDKFRDAKRLIEMS